MVFITTYTHHSQNEDTLGTIKVKGWSGNKLILDGYVFSDHSKLKYSVNRKKTEA